MFVEKQIARNGMPSAALILKNGVKIPLHSTYNPQSEAQKQLSVAENCDLLIVIGGGWGYLPEAANNGKRKIIVLIFSEEVRFYESEKPIFLTQKNIKTIEVAENNNMWQQTLESELAPFCFHSYRVQILDGWEKAAPERTEKTKTAVYNLIERLINDAAVFVRFAKLWHTHFFKNIALQNRYLPDFKPKATAWVVGASPNLEASIEKLRCLDNNSVLIAADTAFPFLVDNGIEPDYAVTIDAQPLSLQHFIGLIPQKTALVADLTALPTVAARFSRIIWCAGAHPLCRLAASYLNLPPLNTVGGNVSVAALSFARLFSPQQILTAGIEFAYPHGKTYSRGTWLPNRWLRSSDRLRSADTENEILLQSRPYRFETPSAAYIPDLFDRYREAWRNELKSPPPRFKAVSEEPQQLALQLHRLPKICTAPLKCREFYKK